MSRTVYTLQLSCLANFSMEKKRKSPSDLLLHMCCWCSFRTDNRVWPFNSTNLQMKAARQTTTVVLRLQPDPFYQPHGFDLRSPPSGISFKKLNNSNGRRVEGKVHLSTQMLVTSLICISMFFPICFRVVCHDYLNLIMPTKEDRQSVVWSTEHPR